MLKYLDLHVEPTGLWLPQSGSGSREVQRDRQTNTLMVLGSLLIFTGIKNVDYHKLCPLSYISEVQLSLEEINMGINALLQPNVHSSALTCICTDCSCIYHFLNIPKLYRKPARKRLILLKRHVNSSITRQFLLQKSKPQRTNIACGSDCGR